MISCENFPLHEVEFWGCFSLFFFLLSKRVFEVSIYSVKYLHNHKINIKVFENIHVFLLVSELVGNNISLFISDFKNHLFSSFCFILTEQMK